MIFNVENISKGIVSIKGQSLAVGDKLQLSDKEFKSMKKICDALSNAGLVKVSSDGKVTKKVSRKTSPKKEVKVEEPRKEVVEEPKKEVVEEEKPKRTFGRRRKSSK